MIDKFIDWFLWISYEEKRLFVSFFCLMFFALSLCSFSLVVIVSGKVIDRVIYTERVFK